MSTTDTSGTAHTFGGAEPDIYPSEPDGRTVFDQLADALSAPVEKEPLKLKVPSRPSVTMVFNPDIDFEMYQTWVERATKGKPGEKKRESPDFLRLALTVISHTNSGVLINGQDAGTDIRQPAMHAKLRVQEGQTGTAIRKLYASDGHVIQTMQKIVEAAGYSLDGDVEVDDEFDPLEIL